MRTRGRTQKVGLGLALALGPVLVPALFGASACRPRPNMCAEARDCGRSACVAGRCQSDAGVPQVDTSTRFVYSPVDVACVNDEPPPSPGVPPLCVLGDSAGARLLLRFAVPLSDQADVVEAYVLLSRAPTVDADPAAISLHASRIVGDWDGRSMVSATLPAFEPSRSAETRIGWSDVVRIDVRDIVKKWRRRDRTDRGLVIESTGSSPSGMAFALAPDGEGAARPPVLELYVK
jgi:hypothetical protein